MRAGPWHRISTTAGFRVVAAILVFVFFTGCASVTARHEKTIPGPAPPQARVDYRWWRARFRITWPKGAEPAWYLDALIAHRIVWPAYRRRADRIPLWRVHRRAVRDALGHQFSFLFYCAPDTAAAVAADIRKNPLVDRLLSAGLLDRVAIDVPGPGESGIAATSDPKWSPDLQAEWPYFIMGVSRLWIGLIDRSVPPTLANDPHPDLAALEAAYQKANARVTTIWQKEGRHALLHHLNAVFGYVPLPLVERFWLQF